MAKKKKNGGGGGTSGGGGGGSGRSHGEQKQGLGENDTAELLSGSEGAFENCKIYDNDENDQKNKTRGSITVVLRVEMHCEGCCSQVKKSLYGLEGTEKVTADMENNTITVIGNVDPIKIRERLQKKLRHKQVQLISPLPKSPANPIITVKKPKEPPISVVVLKILLHCDGCIRRIRKTIMNVKGVASVSMEPEKDLVTVRGTMDVKTLPEVLEKNLKRTVEVVKKPNLDHPRKPVGEGECVKNGVTLKEEEIAAVYVEMKMKEYLNYTQVGVPPPQLFSDENPNACYIM